MTVPTTVTAQAIQAMTQLFETGATRPIEWRRQQLSAMATMLKEHESEISAALNTDVGKPSVEGWLTDIAATRSEITHTLKHLKSWMKPQRVRAGIAAQPGRASIVNEPVGTVLVIAPWNYPIQLLVNPAVAALAAGNTVVVKPSELAPACSALMAKLLPQYVEGVTVVEGGVAVTTELLAHPFDHIFFTGSTTVGKIVMRAAAEHLTPVTLELGGKSPAIIDDSTNIKVAAKRIAWGKFLNAGQTCIAPDYVLITEKHRDTFVDLVIAAIGEFYGTDPQSSPELARVVNQRHLDRLNGLLADHGGSIALGGTSDTDDKYLEPTIIVDPNHSSALMTEEIFGPILPIITVASRQEAIDFVLARPKPLALYAFGEDRDATNAIVDQTSAGGVCVNHVLLQFTVPDLPFGGVGPAGMGRYHGKSGFDTFSNPKGVLRKGTKPDPSLAYPPYTSFKEKILRRVV
ncbi:MAG: aldehyde dehydrogenase family protein [Acidimicrobiales bacterium]|jgi:aldehyde dehydrogenase (NAD+)